MNPAGHAYFFETIPAIKDPIMTMRKKKKSAFSSIWLLRARTATREQTLLAPNSEFIPFWQAFSGRNPCALPQAAHPSRLEDRKDGLEAGPVAQPDRASHF
jgi:hypothetical protein